MKPFLFLSAAFLALQVAPAIAAEPASADAVQTHGREILRKFAEANRYWLLGPPSQVQNFSYTLNRISGTQHFEVTDPATAPRAKVRGVTYSSLLQRLAREPEKADVKEVSEEPGRVRITVAFEPAAGFAIGNGVEGSWNGYHSFRGAEGSVVLDTSRWVPIGASVGRLRETFANYVRVDEGHFVPLAITLQLDDTRYDWHFRLYEPGLWLFDEGISGERRLAWIEQVKINSADARLMQATAESIARAESEKAGKTRLQEFLKANHHWLLPSLKARRGLVYEYRQEAPYLERAWFDPQGNMLARLEATKDSPKSPTRQRLWLADGRSYAGDVTDSFVRLTPGTNAAADPEYWLHRDRIAQHLAMGLALDCAVTRLAREPDTFWAEVKPVQGQGDRYLLVLHSKSDARLFTGTMNIFSSSAYMHDVRYDRSEILCDAASHRPLEEKDYAAGSELKGHYFFEDWLPDPGMLHSGPTPPPGTAPGRIRAVVPYERDGKDQSLEMDARFQFSRPGVWLLERVESRFHGAESGSVGTVKVVPSTAERFQPISLLLKKAEMTSLVIQTIQQAPVGKAEAEVKTGQWSPLDLQAAWTAEAKKSVKDGEYEMPDPIVIGLCRARLVQNSPGNQVELDGISTGSWKEFGTEWKVSLRDRAGREVATVQTNLDVRAESAPASFVVRIDLPPDLAATPERIAVEGTVRRLSGMYHGHGMWMRLMDESAKNAKNPGARR